MVPAFIRPSKPTPVKTPPSGSAWLHEIKFDGWRLQIAKAGKDVRLYTSGGTDIAKRLPRLAASFTDAPGSFLIDGELFLPDATGRPDFQALQMRMPTCDGELAFLAFDMLHRNGRDLRPLPLIDRKRRLARLLDSDRFPAAVLSPWFDDGERTMEAAMVSGLEGIVSKRRDAAYTSGRTSDWTKVKCAAWRAANRERWQLFQPLAAAVKTASQDA